MMTFLVSGGGKGITAQSVIGLAKQYRCKFILLGRTKPTESDEIQRTLQAIHQAGGKANYLSVDITNRSDLRKALASVMQGTLQISGIIHGAGVLADKPIQKKTVQDFEQVYQTKVTGLQNLLACVPINQLKHLVLFSSVAGFYGNIGQADYAIANETLNKMAYQLKREYPACHVVAINWGPWDGGMVTPALKRLFTQRNIQLIPPHVGVKMLVDELNRDAVQVVIGQSIYSPPQFYTPSQKSKIRRRLTLTDNQFLLDHVIGGKPVLPAACAASWMINSCEHLCSGYKFFRFNDFKVLKGIVFDEHLPADIWVEFQVVAEDAETIEFEAKIWSEAEINKIHYSGHVILCRRLPSSPIYTAINHDNSETMDGRSFYENKRLFHGLTFQGIKQILNISPERLTLACHLPTVASRSSGQFPVQTINPYILDVQLQGMLVWTQYFKQQGCLPSQADSFEQFRAIPFDELFYVSLDISTQTQTKLVADIFAHDAEGLLYTRTLGLEVTISERLKMLFA